MNRIYDHIFEIRLIGRQIRIVEIALYTHVVRMMSSTFAELIGLLQSWIKARPHFKRDLDIILGGSRDKDLTTNPVEFVKHAAETLEHVHLISNKLNIINFSSIMKDEEMVELKFCCVVEKLLDRRYSEDACFV